MLTDNGYTNAEFANRISNTYKFDYNAQPSANININASRNAYNGVNKRVIQSTREIVGASPRLVTALDRRLHCQIVVKGSFLNRHIRIKAAKKMDSIQTVIKEAVDKMLFKLSDGWLTAFFIVTISRPKKFMVKAAVLKLKLPKLYKK